MVGNTGSACTTGVLEWFGYEGEYKKQRQNFISMLKNNKISYSELTQKGIVSNYSKRNCGTTI
jgi:hypothetical protein